MSSSLSPLSIGELVFEPTPDDLARFGAALVDTLGGDRGFSDDELREMFFNLLHLLRVARRIARGGSGGNYY